MGAYQGFKYLFGRDSFLRSKDGWRFAFGGMKVDAAPDSLPPGKHPIAVNVRAYKDHSIETRPGTGTPRFTTTASAITDMRNYVALETDGLPRTLARNAADAVYLDNGTQVGTLAAGGLGATLIPFRPNQSPDPYMYIANGADYQKFSAPNPTVVASKAGIAEPQTSCEAAQIAQQFTEVLSPGGTWNTGGTASAWSSGDRSTDIVVNALQDPISPFKEGGIHPSTPPRWSVQVSPTIQYQRGEILYFNGTPQLITIVEEVIAPLSINMTVQAIYYIPGGVVASGNVVLTLQGITAPGASKPQDNQSGVILNNIDVIAQLVRGALIRVGTDTAYVYSVTSGPDNQICVQTFLPSGHVAGENVIGLPTIIINGVQNAGSLAAGTPIIGDQGNVETFTVAAGVGTLTTGPVGGGPTGTIIATPSVVLNGWGPNAHVGAYELGVDQAFNWGLNPDTTYPYTDPTFVSDGDPNTFAWNPGFHSHKYWGCVWGFLSGTPQSNMVLNILSQALTNTEINTIPGHGTDVTPSGNKRSSGIWYSLDNSVTWNQIYNQGQNYGGARAKQWDSIPLPANQDLTHVQVMAFSDAHDDQVQYVFEINISSGAASIGVNTGAYQEDDYLHFSVNVSDPTKLAEAKLQFDVSDGTFLSNYYYYSVRPSDLVPVTANTVSQLGAIQSIVSQTVTNQQAQADGLHISSPTVAGAGQWTEIWIPISELTRIGGDQTKTLANINAVQWVVNATDTLTFSGSSIAFVGGGQPDVGNIGEPYRYRVRPRSSVTGAIGNPCPDMRYGVPAVRQPVQINLPSASYDTQIDFWDVFRFGGAVTSWRYIGSISSAKTTFEDNYSDDAALAGEALDFDNFEPWPSIDVPLNATATTIVGTEAEVTITGATNALRFLPGNIVNLGGQSSYTLRKRPVLISGTTYLFEFVECTVGFNQGTISDNGQVNIYEPKLARQFLPYMWGPDVNGTVFAVGDQLRPGTLYYAKPSNPDSAPDSFNMELTPPSEPLLGGEVLDGLSFVGSTERWWALYSQLGNPLQRYNPVQQPLPRGLAAPFGHCLGEGTLIDTRRGLVPIEEVTTDDYVLTRKGWKRVIFSGQTGIKPVVTLGPLRITKEHKVLVNNEFIAVSDIIEKCQKGSKETLNLHVRRASYLMALSTEGIRNPSTHQTRNILRAGEIERKPTYTWQFGKNTTDQYQQDTKSTIGTRITPIMTLETLRQSQAVSTVDTIDHSGLSLEQSCAYTADANFQFLSLPPICLSEENAVPFPVTGNFIRTLSSKPVPVYDLEVEEEHEFFADGILVHNCTDGQQIYWWAKDGIWGSRDGSLTDDDLHTLFPHDGIPGQSATYGPPPLGRTVQPPDYSRAGTFRLIYNNYYLYAIYQDSTAAYDMLVYDIKRKAWSVDVYPTTISALYTSEQQSGTLETSGTSYADMLMGDTAGNVYKQTPFVNDNGTPITCILATNEFDGGDLRAPKQWGDYFLDASASSAGGVSIQPMSLGLQVAPVQTIPTGGARQRLPLGVQSIVVSDFMGLFITWTDDFSSQTVNTQLHIWDISFQVQPAYTIQWFTFGTSFGAEGYMHIREFIAAYVSTADITVTITSYDGQSPNPIVIPNSGGQYQKILFPVSANKGQLYKFSATSTEKFQFFNEDLSVRVGTWQRQSGYAQVKVFSGDTVSAGVI